MVLLVWTDDLCVHVKEIDDQHKKLFSLINNQHDAIVAHAGKQEVKKTIRELAAYAVYHFQVEERYMQKFNYPGFLDHKAKHDSFIKQIADFEKDYEAERFGLTNDVMYFLVDWWTNHIRGTDKQYTPYFVKNGLGTERQGLQAPSIR